MFTSDRFGRVDDLIGVFAQTQVTKKRRVERVARGVSYVGSNAHVARLPVALCQTLARLGIRREVVCKVRDFVVMSVHGNRLQKTPVGRAQLLPKELSAHSDIRRRLQDPARRARLEQMMRSDVTKRLIHYFIVHYVLVHREVAYWLDKRTYPYRILGEFNAPNQPHILKLVADGAHIVYINIHNEYRMCKNNSKLIHAPYARSVSVDDELRDHSLTEWNFYLWLDEIGAFEAFEHFADDVRRKKQEHDTAKKHSKQKHLANFKHVATRAKAYLLVNQ
jgi:hypothetical protein